KSDGNAAFDGICKYILNGFYGKWAQRYPAIIQSASLDGPELSRELIVSYETGDSYMITRMMGKEWAESGFVEGRHNLVAIAAHITEGARIYLWRLIDRLPRGRVLYCDTDSLVVRQSDVEAFSDVLDDKALGCLQAEKTSASVSIRGLKDYRWNGVDIIKGIKDTAELAPPPPRRNKQEILSNLRATAECITPASYRQKMFPGLYTLLKTATPGLFPIITQTRTLKRQYDKAELLPDSPFTSPFRL
ncbi:unnamed protein product, partial [marine sediment metagenome]